MFEMAYPWLLFGLLLLPLLYFYYAYWRREPALRVSSLHTFMVAARGRRRHLPWTFYVNLAAAALLIAALSRPRFGDEKVVIRSQGIDMIFALDLSGSMSAIDVPPGIGTVAGLEKALEDGRAGNRLTVAKKELTKFVGERPNDRIGLIGFADMAYNISPPTLDHGWLLGHLQRLEPGVIGEQTNIAAPLASGIYRLKDSKLPRRVLVLFTDGRNNVADRIEPRQAAELAKDSNVIIHTVGIGSENAVFPAEAWGRRTYQNVRHEFDEPMLKEIAEKAGGRYFRAADGEGMKKVLSEINKLETTNFEQPKYVDYREIAPRLALGALLLLLFSFVASHTWKMQLP